MIRGICFQTGFTVKLGEALGISLQRIQCFAHKLNLIVRNAAFSKNKVTKKYNFENMVLVEKDLNALATFHTKSGKNMAHLRDTMIAEGEAPVMPEHIHKVRWSPSHKKVLEKEKKHAAVWNKHLQLIVASPTFSEKQKEKAEYLSNFLTDKHARMTSAIMLDILNLFGNVSEEFQLTGEEVQDYVVNLNSQCISIYPCLGDSIIGVSERIHQLNTGVEEARQEHSKVVEEFLVDAKCPVNVAAADLLPLDETEMEDCPAIFIPNSATAFQA